LGRKGGRNRTGKESWTRRRRRKGGSRDAREPRVLERVGGESTGVYFMILIDIREESCMGSATAERMSAIFFFRNKCFFFGKMKF
jgi:hypothetical protein